MIRSARNMTAWPARSSPGAVRTFPAREIARSVHEAARDQARAIAKTEAYAVSCRERKEGRDALRSSEMVAQARSIAPAWPERGQRRVSCRHSRKSAETGELIPLPAPIFAT